MQAEQKNADDEDTASVAGGVVRNDGREGLGNSELGILGTLAAPKTAGVAILEIAAAAAAAVAQELPAVVAVTVVGKAEFQPTNLGQSLVLVPLPQYL